MACINKGDSFVESEKLESHYACNILLACIMTVIFAALLFCANHEVTSCCSDVPALAHYCSFSKVIKHCCSN